MTRSPWSTRPPHRCWFAVRSHGTLEAMIFLGAEGDRLSPLARSIWDLRSTLPADLPAEINALHIPRAVNTHALILRLRHTASRMHISFFPDVFRTKGTKQRPGKLSTYILERFP